MNKIYVDNFFRKTNASYVLRYSDSSDFEYPVNIPPVSPKRGNHGLLFNHEWNTNQRETPPNIGTLSKNSQCQKGQLNKGNLTKRFQKTTAYNYSKDIITPDKSRRNNQNTSQDNNYYKNRGDQSSNVEKITSKTLLRDKVLPRLSTIFRRSNYSTQINSIEDNEQIVATNNDQKYCVHCERRRKKKYNRKLCYAVQPNYAIVGDIDKAPIRYNQTITQNSPLSHNSITRNQTQTKSCLTSSSGSDIVQERRNETLHSNKKKKNKKLQYEYDVLNCDDYPKDKLHKHQQYPSKYFKPYPVYVNTSCQVTNQSGNSMTSSKMQSSASSSFWEYVAERIKSRSKKGPPPPPRCNLDTCELLNSPRQTNDQKPMSPILLGEMPNSPAKMKTPTECKCTKTKSQNQDDAPMSCQEPHDVITQNLADKYNGQILCIHNPSCILINGCLNLPQPKSNGVSNVWRVSQSKKSSVREENRKTKYIENASQYQPPYSIQECLPEFQTEKFVQSICNHNPPCEVVYGCYKPKYDAKLQDSCVHVPMCQKLPECLVNEADVQSVRCSHSPKCTELPLCSKKFLVLTARENTSTQVKPKAKMVCRHEPPCLMMPKCIARVICSKSVPYDAIPDCVHQPCCELIPACCRKAAKEMPSLTSNEEGISLKVPHIPLQQKNRLLRLIRAKRQF